MKKLFILLFTLSFFIFSSCTEGGKPLSKKISPGDVVTLKGAFRLYNGIAPNIRFITEQNEVVGVGTEETCDNETVSTIIRNQTDLDCFFETETIFKYEENINIQYYDKPLMCFSVEKIKILSAEILSENLNIKISKIKFNKKKNFANAQIEISNISNENQKYSNQLLFLNYKGKSYRAYLDSIASTVIDFDFIEIPAGKKIKKDIYFAVEDLIQSGDGIEACSFSYLKTPIEKWTGENAKPILDTDTKKNYETIITKDSLMEPDFNGKYKIAQFGAGTMANGFFIINLETGVVTEGFTFEFALDYSLDSNIIIRNPEKEILDYWKDELKDDEEIPEWCITEYYVFKDDKLMLINRKELP
ncbi:MAG: hypothetical protein K6E69_02700 [Treponema sp.]|uniref:hypothetical protein n=1 Tax=Treponema sp. TaxID=166 RepID=UPI00298DC4CE|nr:hypothetical protein [Treponema sp.]MCR5386006.1 hypothetical protein [Treponema sp.]